MADSPQHISEKNAGEKTVDGVNSFFDGIYNWAEEKIKNLPEGMPKKIMSGFLANPTRATSVFFGPGDLLMTLSGLFNKNEATGERNWLKTISGLFGLGNIGIWFFERPSGNNEDAIDEAAEILKVSIEKASFGNDGIIVLPKKDKNVIDKAKKFTSELVADPVQKIKNTAKELDKDRTALGGLFNVASSVFMLMSGLDIFGFRKRQNKNNSSTADNINTGEIGNAVGSIAAYSAFSIDVDKEGAAKLPKTNPMHYFGQLDPSVASAAFDLQTSFSGFKGGFDDFRKGNILPGIFQMAASTFYMMGAPFMFFMSKHQQKIKKDKMIKEESEEDIKDNLFVKLAATLEEKREQIIGKADENIGRIATHIKENCEYLKHMPDEVIAAGIKAKFTNQTALAAI